MAGSDIRTGTECGSGYGQLPIKLHYMSSTNTIKPKELLSQVNKVVVLQIQDSLFRFTPNYSRSNSSPI
jgi:hypothetical protein